MSQCVTDCRVCAGPSQTGFPCSEINELSLLIKFTVRFMAQLEHLICLCDLSQLVLILL